MSCGHRVVGITNGHSIHAGPLNRDWSFYIYMRLLIKIVFLPIMGIIHQENTNHLAYLFYHTRTKKIEHP